MRSAQPAAPETSCGARLRASAAASIRSLSPAYFAMVMATGIVSLAAHQMGLPLVADILFRLNICVYIVLLGLNAFRLSRYSRLVVGDMTDHQRGPGFFTTVAASCVLGSQFVLIDGNASIATLLLVVGIILWIVLTYTIFTALTIKETKPSLADGITGAWLLAVVATQSIVVLTALLSERWGEAGEAIANFLALSGWLFGGMLYIWMISLIFYRYTFFTMSPADLTPPYWINMGAMAISTLAGARLVANSSGDPFLLSILPFLKGFTVLYWATGTWWIPMLLALGVWRHLFRKVPLRYHPLYWGAVFPLGMYTVCTLQMSRALDLGFLAVVPRVTLYIALLAWLAVFAGWITTATRRMIDVMRAR